MDIVKKNLLSIICGAVALLAVVVIFFPLGGKFEQLEKKLGESEQLYGELNSAARKQFTLPNVKENSNETVALEYYPTEQLITEGKKVVEDLKVQADRLVAESRKYNQRQPLIPNVFPNGRGAVLSAFKAEYYSQFDRFKSAMNATLPPTEAEVAIEAERQWKAHWEPRITVGPGGQQLNAQAVRDEFAKDLVNLPQRMRAQRARQFTMYIAGERPVMGAAGAAGGVVTGGSGGAFTTFDYFPAFPARESGELPPVEMAWQEQLALWIQEDVVRAVIETNGLAAPNAPKPTVEKAAVKRLVKIVVPREYVTRTGPLRLEDARQQAAQVAAAAAAQAAQGGMDTGVPEDPAAAAKLVPTASMTGRVSNIAYDVMHFHVVVDVDATKFREFMANLTANRFVTVLEADVRAVDRERAVQRGYVYGDAPVVQLRIKCEAIFFRDWTVKLMPKTVQQMLRIPDPAAAAGTGTVAGM